MISSQNHLLGKIPHHQALSASSVSKNPKSHPRSPKQENLSLDLKLRFMWRLPSAKPTRALLGLCPLSGPALLFCRHRALSECSFAALSSSWRAEPGKPTLPLQALCRAGEQSWAVYVSGSEQKEKKRPANRAWAEKELEDNNNIIINDKI